MALTANKDRSKKIHTLRIVALPVKAGEVLYDGALVCTEDATGLAVPAADSAGLTFQGVVIPGRGLDNTNGANGVVNGNLSERYVEVDVNGPWQFAVDGTAPKAGQDALIVDDDETSADATSNDIKCGRFLQPAGDGSGEWMVDIERGQ